MSFRLAMPDKKPTHSSTLDNKSVYVDDNPLNCDCSAYELASYLLEQVESGSGRLRIEAPSLACHSPKQLRNVSIVDALHTLPSEFQCKCQMEEPCACTRLPALNTLLVSCTRFNLTEFPATAPSRSNYSTMMDLSSNLISAIKMPLEQYADVTHLDVSGNALESAFLETTFAPGNGMTLSRLSYANLSWNRFTHVPDAVIQSWLQWPLNLTVTLHDNPWQCQCHLLPLARFLRRHHAADSEPVGPVRVDGISGVFCSDGRLVVSVTDDDLCSQSHVNVILITVAVLVLLLALLSLLFWHWSPKTSVEDDDDQEMRYDAFISYSHHDEQFVFQQLMPPLECPPSNGRHAKYKLLLHGRDWLAGEYIPESIRRSVRASQRTIIVLTDSFLTSYWAQFEFRTAFEYHNVARNKPRCLIIIVNGDLPDNSRMPEIMKDYLNGYTYLKWGDDHFWERLRAILPSKKAVQITSAAIGMLELP